jgi:hypothetical protein
MKNLLDHFKQLADMQPDEHVGNAIYKALVVGADAALTRIRVIGGGYPTGADVTAVEKELAGDTRVAADEAPPLAPETPLEHAAPVALGDPL